MKLLKTKGQTKFNDISLKNISNELNYYYSWAEVENHLHCRHDGYLIHCEIHEIPCDELSINKNGVLYRKAASQAPSVRGYRKKNRVPPNAKYQLYKHTFHQLLNFLQIPVSFAKRISSDLLLLIVNRLLSEKYDRNLGIRLGRNSDGFHTLSVYPSGSRSILSVYELFRKVNDGQLRDSTNIQMLYSIFDGLMASIYCRFAKRQRTDLFPGVELFYSDGFDCNPTVSGIMMNKRGFAILRSLSFPLDVSSGQSREQILKTVNSAIVQVYSSIDKFTDAKDVLQGRGLTDREVEALLSRASKMMNKPFELCHTMTLMDIFDETMRYQNRKNIPLLEKRRAGIFAGWLIEHADKNLIKK